MKTFGRKKFFAFAKLQHENCCFAGRSCHPTCRFLPFFYFKQHPSIIFAGSYTSENFSSNLTCKIVQKRGELWVKAGCVFMQQFLDVRKWMLPVSGIPVY